MSLLVHMPLTGNLNNIGLRSGSGMYNSGTPSWNDSGKIGKCYTYVSGTFPISPLISVGTYCTIAGWVKTSTSGGMLFGMPCSASNYLNIYQTNGLCLNTGDSASNPFLDASGNRCSVINDGVWHHLAFVFRGTEKCKYYKDGVYQGQATTYVNPTASSKNWSIGGATGYGSSYVTNGQFNDLRIYDHALSDQEVRNISLGLVCHYLMTDGHISKNLIIDTDKELISLGGGDGVTLEKFENGSKVTNPNSWIRLVYDNESASAARVQANSGKVMTVSFDYYIISGNGLPSFFCNSSYMPMEGNANLIGKWQRIKKTFTHSGYNSSYGYYTPHITGGATSYYIKNLKLEVGDNPNPKYSTSKSLAEYYNLPTKTLSDGSQWARIFYHNTSTNIYFLESELFNCKTPIKESRMDVVDKFKTNSGVYEFMLTYPDLSDTLYNRWSQISSPNTNSGETTGFTAITTAWSSFNKGIALSSSSETKWNCNNGSGSWYGAIGQTRAWTSSYHIPAADGNSHNITELWVRVDNVYTDIEYDSSGLQNDGFCIEVICSSDKPKYIESYQLENTSVIEIPSLPYLTNCSISFWRKSSDNYWLFAGSNDSGGRYIAATYPGHASFYYGGCGSPQAYIDGNAVTDYIDDNNWHFYCFSGLDLSNWPVININKYTNSPGNGFNSNGELLSDFRLYATVLSADDVKILYNQRIL